MHEEITRQVRDMVAAAAKTEVPAQVRAVGQESVAKAREACAKLNAVAEKGAKAFNFAQASRAHALLTDGPPLAGTWVPWPRQPPCSVPGDLFVHLNLLLHWASPPGPFPGNHGERISSHGASPIFYVALHQSSIALQHIHAKYGLEGGLGWCLTPAAGG